MSIASKNFEIQSEVQVELVIFTKKLSVAELIQKLGGAGDAYADRNDLLKNGKKEEYSWIEFHTKRERSKDIRIQYEEIVKRIETLKLFERILDMISRKEAFCVWRITVVFENIQPPKMHLDKTFIELVDKMNSRIEFDIYA